MTFTFKVFCADCKAEYTQTIKNHEFKPTCCGVCGSDWIAVKTVTDDEGVCVRCGSYLRESGFCSDPTCMFDQHSQSCIAGWFGHLTYYDVGLDDCTCEHTF